MKWIIITRREIVGMRKGGGHFLIILAFATTLRYSSRLVMVLSLNKRIWGEIHNLYFLLCLLWMRSLVVKPLAPPDVFVQFLQSYSPVLILVQGRQLPGQLLTEDEKFHSITTWSNLIFNSNLLIFLVVCLLKKNRLFLSSSLSRTSARALPTCYYQH